MSQIALFNPSITISVPSYDLFEAESLSGTVSVTNMTCWHILHILTIFNIHPPLSLSLRPRAGCY